MLFINVSIASEMCLICNYAFFLLKLEAFFSLEVWSLVLRIAACLTMLIMVAGADQGDQENPWIKQTGNFSYMEKPGGGTDRGLRTSHLPHVSVPTPALVSRVT